MSEPSASTTAHRPIRSFVRREGRLTTGQQRALATLMPAYGLAPSEGALDLETAFGRRAPVIMDIGFGNGEALADMAAADPERDYLGVEVYRPGIGRLLPRLEAEGIANVRVIEADAAALLRANIAAASLAGVQLLFPDPWPKKRHHKRRMVQPGWLELVANRLVPGGFLHLATDWQDYAEYMLSVAEASAAFRNPAGTGCFAAARGERPETRFERRGRGKGHAVWDLVLYRCAP